MLNNDYRFAYKLAEKGIRIDESAYEIVRHCAQHPSDWKMARLLRDGAQIGIENYAAMNAFIKQGWSDAGEILLDRDMDFGAYKQWADEYRIICLRMYLSRS